SPKCFGEALFYSGDCQRLPLVSNGEHPPV
ncbi:MAG: hypothetical protein ACJATF_003417, partial [Flavobacteriales bacterium]